MPEIGGGGGGGGTDILVKISSKLFRHFCEDGFEICSKIPYRRHLNPWVLFFKTGFCPQIVT